MKVEDATQSHHIKLNINVANKQNKIKKKNTAQY